MHLADGVEDTLDAIATIRKRRPEARILATATVLQELHFLTKITTGATQQIAKDALTGLRRHNIEPINFIPVGHGIIEVTADKIRARGLLPEEEKNDSFLLAEAALLGCNILLSSDGHLRSVPYEQLKMLLDECDVNTPLICSPSEVVRKFFR
jgi:hypothetical protein